MNRIIFDLEATCEHDRSIEHEVIEIGAVKVNEEGRVMDTFSIFVKPEQNPVLTPFCINLTTIQQSDVEDAPVFREAIETFQKWIGEEPYVLASWGFFDKKLLAKQLDERNLDTDWLTPHVNLKQTYADLKRLKRPCGVQKALRKEGLTFEGTAHRGIDDAINIARIYAAHPDKLIPVAK